jgi:hypothetical protein
VRRGGGLIRRGDSVTAACFFPIRHNEEFILMANYEATPSPTTTADFPGKTLGIVGLVLAILAPVVGIIVSAVALSQSKKAGFENKLAKIGLIVGIVLTVVYVVLYIVVFATALTAGVANY